MDATGIYLSFIITATLPSIDSCVVICLVCILISCIYLIFKNSNSKIKSDSAIGQHLIKNPECAKTCSDDNFRITGQARSSFHLCVLESIYIKTQNPVLCKQKEFTFSLGLFK